MYRIWKAIKYHFKADKHTLAYIIALVNGVSSASFTDIATYVAENYYSACWDSPGVFCCFSTGFIGVSC